MLAKRLNLKVIPTSLAVADIPTRQQRRLEELKQSTTDYVLSDLTGLIVDIEVPEPDCKMDHNLLKANIYLENMPHLQKQRTRKKRKVFKPKPDLSSEEQKRILVHPDWPKRPYNIIA